MVIVLFNLLANPALNLAPFSRWTLRDKAAKRRTTPRIKPTSGRESLRLSALRGLSAAPLGLQFVTQKKMPRPQNLWVGG